MKYTGSQVANIARGKYSKRQSAIFVTRLSPRAVCVEAAVLYVFYCILHLLSVNKIQFFDHSK